MTSKHRVQLAVEQLEERDCPSVAASTATMSVQAPVGPVAIGAAPGYYRGYYPFGYGPAGAYWADGHWFAFGYGRGYGLPYYLPYRYPYPAGTGVPTERNTVLAAAPSALESAMTDAAAAVAGRELAFVATASTPAVAPSALGGAAPAEKAFAAQDDLAVRAAAAPSASVAAGGEQMVFLDHFFALPEAASEPAAAKMTAVRRV